MSEYKIQYVSTKFATDARTHGQTLVRLDTSSRGVLAPPAGPVGRKTRPLRGRNNYLSRLTTSELQRYKVDVLELTAPCIGRAKLRFHNADKALAEGIPVRFYEEHWDNDLFQYAVYIAKLLQPLVVISEMTPPHSRSFKDHVRAGNLLRSELGYSVDIADKLPTNLCGD